MKNRIIIFTFIFFIANLAFAKPKFIDEPKKNEVTLVGRITFKTDMERNWLYGAVDLPEDQRKYQDIYVMPFSSAYAKYVEEGETVWLKSNDKAKDILKFEEQAWSVNGGYFFVKYELGKERTVYLSAATVFIGASYLLPVLLPLNLKITVPADEKFLYIGDYTFNAKGFGFELTASVSENFEEAQVALNSVTEKEYQLSRANPERLSAKDMEKVQFAYESPTTDFKKWYKLFKELPTIEEVDEIE